MLDTLREILSRKLQQIAGVESAEQKPVWGAFCFAFILMTAYYILRPIRDGMSSNWSDAELSNLFTITFIASTLASLIYSQLYHKVRSQHLVRGVYLLFATSFAGFYLLMKMNAGSTVWARYFYVWVSVFSLFQFSVFWSFMADVFTRTQATRLFAFISAGASLGAITGPTLALLLSARLGLSNLVLISSLLLFLPLAFISMLEGYAASVATEPASRHDRISGLAQLATGVLQVIRDRHLLAISVFILLFTAIGTFVYFELKNMLAGMDAVTRTQIWSGMDLAVNIISVVTALFITGRLTARFGLTSVLGAIPAMTVVGLLWIAFVPYLWVVIVLQCARRAGDYAVTRPGREMLYTIVSRDKRFQAKNVIDTVVYRAGDVLAAWCFTGLTQGIGANLSMIAVVGALIALLWFAAGIYLGRWYDAAAQHHE